MILNVIFYNIRACYVIKCHQKLWSSLYILIQLDNPVFIQNPQGMNVLVEMLLLLLATIDWRKLQRSVTKSLTESYKVMWWFLMEIFMLLLVAVGWRSAGKWLSHTQLCDGDGLELNEKSLLLLVGRRDESSACIIRM